MKIPPINSANLDGKPQEGEATAPASETGKEYRNRFRKPRGRPPAFEPEFDRTCRPVWSYLRTMRGLRNAQYATLGCRAIRPDGKLNPQHDWFAGAKVRMGVLVELGRIAVRYGDDTALAMADKLARQVANGRLTTTREAAAWLRRARLGASGKPTTASAGSLERLITTIILNYIAEHPDATAALVEEALCGAYSIADVLADKKPLPSRT